VFNRLRCFDEILISGCSIACIQSGQQWDPPSFSTAICILFPAKTIVFSDSRLLIMLKSVLLFRLLPNVSEFPYMPCFPIPGLWTCMHHMISHSFSSGIVFCFLFKF